MELNLLINNRIRIFQVVALNILRIQGSSFEHALEARVVEQKETEVVPPYEEKRIILYRGSYRIVFLLRMKIEEEGGIESPKIFRKYYYIAIFLQ